MAEYDHTVIIEGVEYEVSFNVTHWGCPSNGWDEPGESPEVDLTKIKVGDEIMLSLPTETWRILEAGCVQYVADNPSIGDIDYD